MNVFSSQIFRILFLLFLAMIFSSLSHAKTIDCPKAYKLHQDTIEKYMIRIEDSIFSEGCDVIPIYAAIIEAEKFDVLDEVEENPKVLRDLKKLSSINSSFLKLLLNNETIKSIILTNSLNKSFLENFIYLTKKKLQKREIKKIAKDNNYLNYFLLAALYGKDNKESLKLYSKIKSSVSLELIPSFSLVLSSVGSNYKFLDLLDNFSTLTKELSSDAVKTLVQYPQYFVYFLYPLESSLTMGLLSTDKLEEVQKSIQKEVIYIYRKIFNKYRYKKNTNQIDYALLTIEKIYPYLLENPTLNYSKFTRLFKKLIDEGYMLSLFQEDKCSKTTQENFAVFGQGNINKAIELLKHEKQFSQKIFSEFKDPHYSIMSFFYVANAYGNLNEREWKIFKELLETLPYEYDNKIVFLQRIEQSGYFRNIVQQRDYNEYIEQENLDYGQSNPKYKYVLLTPYPSQVDRTLFSAVLETTIDNEMLQKSLVDLISKSKEELEIHKFTTMEKFLGNLETLDNIATVSSVVLAPFTGGASLSYVAIVAAKKATQVASKKSFKHFRQKIELNSRKLMNKSIRKSRVIRKSIDSKIGVSTRNNIGKVMDATGDVLTVSSIVGSAALIFFNTNALELKQICQE